MPYYIGDLKGGPNLENYPFEVQGLLQGLVLGSMLLWRHLLFCVQDRRSVENHFGSMAVLFFHKTPGMQRKKCGTKDSGFAV